VAVHIVEEAKAPRRRFELRTWRYEVQFLLQYVLRYGLYLGNGMAWGNRGFSKITLWFYCHISKSVPIGWRSRWPLELVLAVVN